MMEPSFNIFISLRKIIFILNCIFLLLFFANLIACFFKYIAGHPSVYGFVEKFYLSSEGNIPTYFSAIILLISSILLKIIALFKKNKNDTFSVKWSILSIIFLYLSIDEAANIHELTTLPLRRIFYLKGVFYYSWVIIGIVFILIFSISYYKFLFSLPSKTKYQFLLAAAIYIGGAIGIEMLGGNYHYINQGNNLTYGLITTLEESFEIIGIIIFINALLRYIETNIINVNLIFKSETHSKK